MTQPFPKKYWWAVLIATPLLTAAIAILPKLWSGSSSGGDSINISGSDIRGSVQIVETQQIFNEIQQVVSDPTELRELRKSVEKAVNLAKNGFNEKAIEAFETISQQHELASVYSNIGALEFEVGNQAGSLQAYQTALSLKPDSEELLNKLTTLYEKQGRPDEAMHLQLRAKGSETVSHSLPRPDSGDKTGSEVFTESEDNGNLETANPMQTGTTVEGAVSSDTDLDVYQFQFPEGPRDYLKVQIKPVDRAMIAKFELHDTDWERLWVVEANTEGQRFSHTFTGTPNETYYLTISRINWAGTSTTGEYQLSIEPLHAFDSNEPNENIIQATNISKGSPVKANILDEDDKDFYAFVADKENLQFKLINEENELRPDVEQWGYDKASLDHFFASNMSQNLNGDLKLEKGEKYYLYVHGSGQGAYSIVLE